MITKRELIEALRSFGDDDQVLVFDHETEAFVDIEDTGEDGGRAVLEINQCRI